MKGMNTQRILFGGLLAGLVINVSETVLNMVVLADSAAMAGMASWALPAFILMAFAWGIIFVAAYAAIRPRFGAGWTTAALAGTAMWIVGSLLPTVGLLGMQLVEPNPALIATVWVFFEFNLAAVAGAWVYREEAAPAAQPAGYRP